MPGEPGAGAGHEQAGRAQALAFGGCLLATGHGPPSGPREQVLGLVGVKRGPGRLPQGGHRSLEAGAGALVVLPGQRHADGQAATGGSDLAELLEHDLEDGWLQVDGDPFEQEQARCGRLESGGAQPVRHRVPGEVGLDEPHVRRGDAEPLQPCQLVPLGRGMVRLEPADARLGVAERAAVVAGRADHDLPHATVDGADDGPVEERGARSEVVVHPVRRGYQPGRHVGG